MLRGRFGGGCLTCKSSLLSRNRRLVISLCYFDPTFMMNECECLGATECKCRENCSPSRMRSEAPMVISPMSS